MSLSDLILNQPIILLAILAALLPVFAVPVIWLAFKLRQRRRDRPPKERTRNRSRKGASAAARPTASKRARPAEGSAAAPARAASAARAHAAAPATEAQPEAEAISAEEEAQPSAEAQPAAEDAPAEEAQADEDKNKAADIGSEMQALLDSVFNDDEAFERLKVLLEGTDTVDIHDLRSLADKVAAQLGAASPAA